MFDYDKKYDISEFTNHFAESIANLQQNNISLQDLRNLNSAFYFAIYDIKAEQLLSREEPLSKEEYKIIFDDYSIMTAPKSVFNKQDKLFKVLLKQPLKSLDYLFEFISKYSPHEYILINTILQKHGFVLSQKRREQYRGRFSMFNKREQNELILKAFWRDIKNDRTNI